MRGLEIGCVVNTLNNIYKPSFEILLQLDVLRPRGVKSPMRSDHLQYMIFSKSKSCLPLPQTKRPQRCLCGPSDHPCRLKAKGRKEREKKKRKENDSLKVLNNFCSDPRQCLHATSLHTRNVLWRWPERSDGFGFCASVVWPEEKSLLWQVLFFCITFVELVLRIHD